MVSQRRVEIAVGLFILAAVACLLILAFKISGLTSFFNQNYYRVTAQFDEIGQLKTRAPVKIGGVTIGKVGDIYLDKNYKANVTLLIDDHIADIPDDSSISILTAGLLGDNYIAITPMYSSNFLTNGSTIQETHSAMILEKLIGQLLFKVSNGSAQSKSTRS